LRLRFSYLALLATLALTTGLFADTKEEPPLITVTGSAEVNVTPDLAELSFGVETRDKDLAVATSRNSAAVTAVLAAIKKFSVAPKDVQTAAVEITPSYDDEKNGRRLQYFSVETDFRVTLRKLEDTGDFLSEVVKAGANQVHFVRFGSSESRKHADQARLLALRAAKEKALAAAKELGVQLGKPYSVTEKDGQGSGRGANTVLPSEGFYYFRQNIEPGQVRISAQFTVSFLIQ
jgi:uncharacterized protein YggE